MFRKCVLTSFGAVLIAALPCLGQTPAPSIGSMDFVPEVEAKVWLNPQPAQLYARPQYALVVFLSSRSPLPPPVLSAVNDLQRRYRNGRLLVVGLSEDKAKRVEEDLRRGKIKFKVGAESRSAKKFGVTEAPAAVLVDLKSREMRWNAQGAQLEAKTLRKAVTEFLGDPEGHDRSERLAEEESADRSLVAARGAAAESEIATITDQVLSETAQQPWIEPEDLAALDEFYERHLPSDPDRPGARSENTARMYAMGEDGDVGYGGLYKSGRLSDFAKAYIRERLLSIAQEDPSERQSALSTLRRQVGADASDAWDAMLAMRAAEPDRWVRASWDMTIDAVDPSPSPEVKARLERPINAPRLRRLLNNSPDPTATRWSDAHAYLETVTQRSTQQLLDDYAGFSDNEDEQQRENAVLKRSFAMDTIAVRIKPDITTTVSGLPSRLLQNLGSESDPTTRVTIVRALQSIAQQTVPEEREQIIGGLERQLAHERDPYNAKPTVEQAIEDLKKLP